MYQHVVVPLDGSPLAETALGPAAELARRSGANLLLYSRVEAEARPPDLEDYLVEVADRLDGVETATTVTSAGSASAGIEQIAGSVERAIVCMSSHGRGGIGRSLLGSVAEEVLARVGGPMVLVGPHVDAERSPVEGTLVACVDGSKLSEAILEPVSEWAATFGMTVVLAQVIAQNIEATLRAAGVRPEDVQEGSYVSGLSLLLKGRGVERTDWEVLRHHDPHQPAERIVEFARERQAGLVALSTHGRTGLRRLVIGSVAMRVVHDSPCPVLVGRPSELAGD
jgi:nucleotide-binding universal stress UspA family protein